MLLLLIKNKKLWKISQHHLSINLFLQKTEKVRGMWKVSKRVLTVWWFDSKSWGNKNHICNKIILSKINSTWSLPFQSSIKIFSPLKILSLHSTLTLSPTQTNIHKFRPISSIKSLVSTKLKRIVMQSCRSTRIEVERWQSRTSGRWL